MKKALLFLSLLISYLTFAQPQKEVLLDDFDGKTDYDWTSGSTPEHYKTIKKGFFHIINKSKSKITWNSVRVPIDTSNNFSIETSVALFQENEGEAFLIYGEDKKALKFHFVRIRDVKNKYSIQFGTFQNGKWEGDWRNITINPLKQFNRITVRRKGKEMLFLINGIIEHREPFKPFFGDTIALGTGGPQHAVFDYILVFDEREGN